MLKYFPFQLNSANPAMRNKIPLRKLHVKVRLLRHKFFLLNMGFQNFQIKLVMNFHLRILNFFEIRDRKLLMEFVSEGFQKVLLEKKVKFFGNL